MVAGSFLFILCTSADILSKDRSTGNTFYVFVGDRAVALLSEVKGAIC